MSERHQDRGCVVPALLRSLDQGIDLAGSEVLTGANLSKQAH
jgi:hypothetical protein